MDDLDRMDSGWGNTHRVVCFSSLYCIPRFSVFFESTHSGYSAECDGDCLRITPRYHGADYNSLHSGWGIAYHTFGVNQ